MASEKQWALMAMAGGSVRSECARRESECGLGGRNGRGATARARAQLKGSEAARWRTWERGRGARSCGLDSASVRRERERLEEEGGADRWASTVSERGRRERRGGLAVAAGMLGLGPKGRIGALAGYGGETGTGRPK